MTRCREKDFPPPEGLKWQRRKTQMGQFGFKLKGSVMSAGEMRDLHYGAAVVEEGVWPFPITSSLSVGDSLFFL